jgi:hypothetical protein
MSAFPGRAHRWRRLPGPSLEAAAVPVRSTRTGFVSDRDLPLLIVLSGLALVQSLRGKSLGAAETSMILGVGEEGLGRRRPLLALLVLLLAAAYAAALHWVPLGFFWATTAFVFAAGFAMSQRSLKAAAIALAVALGVSGALTFVFGGLLGFPLP